MNPLSIAYRLIAPDTWVLLRALAAGLVLVGLVAHVLGRVWRSRVVFKIRRIGTRPPSYSELGHSLPLADAAEDVPRRINSASTFHGRDRRLKELQEAEANVLRFDRQRLDRAAMSPHGLYERRN